ncbi:MAG: hypothetical protein WCK29_00840, partial [archaeon]
LGILVMGSFFVQGFKLGVSPAEWDVDLDENEEICTNFTIYSSENNIKIAVEDYWSDNFDRERNISDYILNSDDFNINLKYKSSINIKKEQKFNLCIGAEKEGYYSGVIFFESEAKGLSVGSFIQLKVLKNVSSSDNRDLMAKDSITGFAIFNDFNYQTNPFLLALIFSSLGLMVLLYLLIELAKKRREKTD